MNDLLQLFIFISISVIGLVIGFVFLSKDWYGRTGFFIMFSCTVIAALVTTIPVEAMADRNFNSIPYNNTPEAEYQLTEANIPIYQTGSEHSITFFTKDYACVTINYDEMNFTYDNVDTPVLQVYGRNDGGAEWLGRDQKKRVVVILPEEYETNRSAVHQQ